MGREQPVPAKRIVSQLLVCFAALSLLTAFILTFFGGQHLVTKNVPASGAKLGPFRIAEASTILDVKVQQSLPLNTWSNVTVSLIDSKDRSLTGFGDEFWHEQGRDAEGYYWREQERTYQTRVVVDQPGTYFLGVSVDNNLSGSQQSRSQINIRVSEGGFSYIPHFAAGVIALLGAVLLSLIKTIPGLPSGKRAS